MERAPPAFQVQFDLLVMQHIKGILSANTYSVRLMNMLSIIRASRATPHTDFTTRVRSLRAIGVFFTLGLVPMIVFCG